MRSNFFSIACATAATSKDGPAAEGTERPYSRFRSSATSWTGPGRLMMTTWATREGEIRTMKYQVLNPSTGQVEQEYPTATDAEISDILDRAGRGYPAWRRTAMAERTEILRRVAQLYEDRSAE